MASPPLATSNFIASGTSLELRADVRTWIEGATSGSRTDASVGGCGGRDPDASSS